MRLCRLTLVLVPLLWAGCASIAEDPFEVFYTPGWQNTVNPMPAYTGAPLSPAPVDPPVEYVQLISLEQAESISREFAAQGYRRIGMSALETNWPVPHREAAAQMGRKLGADLVAYAVVGVGTRLQSVPRLTYEPGQSYSGTASGFVGGTYGSLSTYGSTSGTFHTQFVPQEVGRYAHVAYYLVNIKKPY